MCQYNRCVSAGSLLFYRNLYLWNLMDLFLLCGAIMLQLHLHFYTSCFNGNGRLHSCKCLNPQSNDCISSWPFFSCINRVSASWRQPSCTSSSWHRSAGSSRRPGSPTWQWRERFGPGSSASAFCVSAGVSKQRVSLNPSIISDCTSQLPFSVKVSGQGVSPSNCMSFFVRCSHPLCGGSQIFILSGSFVVMLLCSSQALLGLGKWTGLEQWGETDWCGSPIAGCNDLMSDKEGVSRAFTLQQNTF